MRKLASVRTIAALDPIPNADAIEKATIDGWEVVVKKGEFEIGDSCVFIEVDSIVPAIEYFEFMEKRKYRVKTIKLRKQVSQGLVIPLNDINKIRHQLGITDPNKEIVLLHLDEGTDLTSDLGIKKYDPETKKENMLLSDSKKKKNPVHKFLLRYGWYRKLWVKRKAWPEQVVKTDEERIQNCPSILRNHDRATFYETEKLDGQSATFFYLKQPWFWKFKKKVFGVCSRNIWLKTKHPCNYWDVADKYDIQNKLKHYGKEVVIQGEIIGPGIQKNKYNRSELEFYVFNVYNVATDEWYGRRGIEAVCADLDLKMVPVIKEQKLQLFGEDVPGIVEHVKGNSTLAKVKREGSVFRQINTEKGKRGVSFKAINPEFLLKFDD